MKRFLALLLAALLLFSANADWPAPPMPVENPEGIAEQALPLMTLLCACPSFASFTGAPGEALQRQAEENLPCFYEGELPAQRAEQLFTAWEALPEQMPSTAPCIPTQVEIESVLDTGTGCVLACVRVLQDFGDGCFEFSFSAEFTLRPAEDALFGARVERVFIPE